MKRFLVFSLLLCAAPAQAHQQPIRANAFILTADPKQLVLELVASAPWWIADVLGDQTPPPHHWPDELRAKTKTYFDKHVVLKLDGRVLESKWVDARYNEEVWRYYGGSRFILQFAYPITALTGTLTGEITLYKEDYRTPAAGATPNPNMEFLSVIQIHGSKPQRLVVPIEKPQFSIPLSDVVRTAPQRWRDDAVEGLVFWQGLPAILLLFSAVPLLSAERCTRRTLAIVTALAAIGATAAVAHFTAGGAARATGVFAMLSLWSALLAVCLTLYRARLTHESEMMAPVLFASQTRIAGIVCIGIGIYLAIKGS